MKSIFPYPQVLLFRFFFWFSHCDFFADAVIFHPGGFVIRSLVLGDASIQVVKFFVE